MIGNLAGVGLVEVQLHPVVADVGGVAVAGDVEKAGAVFVQRDGVVGAVSEAGTVGTVAAHLDLPEGVRTRLHELVAVPAIQVNRMHVWAKKKQLKKFKKIERARERERERERKRGWVG